MSATTTARAPGRFGRWKVGHWKGGRCQFEQSPRSWPMLLAVGRAAVVAVRRRWWQRGVPRGLGAPSVFGYGQTVRVKSRDEIARMLDENHSSRGLLFMESQWAFCGRTMVVDRVVRQMLDDRLVLRPISRAVILAGATCDSGGAGCGRACGLLWKDEWLESATPAGNRTPGPRDWDQGERRGPVARIRPLRELKELAGVGGIGLPLDADRYAGTSAVVEGRVRMPKRVATAVPAPAVGEWFMLRGVRCEGRELANPHPCDRRCSLLWHRSWLDFDPDEPPPLG